MEDKELHPVVELLLARMESHPEEFQAGTNRWDWAIRKVQDNGTEAELEALNDALRPIRLAEAHEWMMDELLNGEDRRRKEREEYELTAATAQRLPTYLGQYANQTANTGLLNSLRKGLGL